MISWKFSLSTMIGVCGQPSALWSGVSPHDKIRLCIVSACAFNDWMCVKASAARGGADPCQRN
jgi:hypothetical protein